MRNKYFDELVTENDLFYVCFMIEKTSRFLHQRNQLQLTANSVRL